MQAAETRPTLYPPGQQVAGAQQQAQPAAAMIEPAALMRLMRRRVPPEKRQRTEMSCDWCKKKRCKCLRGNTTDTCRACSEIGRPCTTTEPRKRRVYGSLSALSGTASGGSANVSANVHVNAGVSGSARRASEPSSAVAPAASLPVQDEITVATDRQSQEVRKGPTQKGQKGPTGPPGQRYPTQQQQDTPPDDKQYDEVEDGACQRYMGGALGSYDLLVQLWEVMARRSTMMMPQATGPTRVGDARGRSIDLPPREVADLLVAVFFDTVHCDFPVFHRGLFQAHYEAMWASPQHRHDHAHTPDTQPAWLMCLCMVFVLGLEAASAQSRGKLRRLLGSAATIAVATAAADALKDRYLAKTQEMLPQVIGGSMLVHVQALLLYCRYLHMTRNRNACWNLTGAAIRVAVAIGLHRTGGGAPCAPLDRELRRRVWWTLYAFERMECSSLGRPSAIDDAECSVGVPADDLVDMTDTVPRGYVAVLAELMTILGSICKHQYGGSRPSDESQSQSRGVTAAHVEFAVSTAEALDLWHAHLPPHLRLGSDSPPSQARSILLLHVQYHYTVTLLCRPFLLALVAKKPPTVGSAASAVSASAVSASAVSAASSASAAASAASAAAGAVGAGQQWFDAWSPVQMFAHKCVDSAKAAVAVLDQLFRAGLFNSKTWWDVYFIEAICLILAMGRFAADKDLRHDAGILDALQTCIHILQECKEFSPTMQRFALVTQDFAQALVAEVARSSSRRSSESVRSEKASEAEPQMPSPPVEPLRPPPAPQALSHPQHPLPHGLVPQDPLPHDPPPQQQPPLDPFYYEPPSYQQTMFQSLELDDMADLADLGDLTTASATSVASVASAASTSSSSPEDSFVPMLPPPPSSHALPLSDLSDLSDPVVQPWDMTDVSPAWGEWPEHEQWWQ